MTAYYYVHGRARYIGSGIPNNKFFNIVDSAIKEAQKRGKDLGKI